MKNTLALILALILHTNSQVNIEWYSQYSSPDNYMDKSYAVTTDSEGGVYITGEAFAYYGSDLRSSEYDIVTVKYSPTGQEQWVRNYHYCNYDGASSIVCDQNDNIIVTGLSQDSNYAMNFVVLKYDKMGNVLWTKRYDNPEYNFDSQPEGMMIDDNSNVFAFGYSTDYNSSHSSAELVKYSSNGNLLWSRSYRRGNTDFNRATCLAIDNTGNLIVGCYTQDSLGADYLLLKYSQNGELVWSSRKDINNKYNIAKDIGIDQTNNIYLCGYTYNSYTPSEFDIMKFSPDGVFLWSRSLVGPFVQNFFTLPPIKFLRVDFAGNVIVTFRSDDSLSGTHTKIVKLNSVGNFVWIKTDMIYKIPTNIILDGTGNVYLTSYSFGFSAHNSYAIQKYSSAGDQLWINMNTGLFNFDFVPYGICFDKDSNIVATGETNFSHPSNYLTIKLNQPIGMQPISTEIPKQFSLSQNYPNPFNPSSKIKFSVPKSSFTKLKVYDILGREVRTLVNEELKQGIYEIEFSANDLPSGVYFYSISAGDYTSVKKMVLLK